MPLAAVTWLRALPTFALLVQQDGINQNYASSTRLESEMPTTRTTQFSSWSSTSSSHRFISTNDTPLTGIFALCSLEPSLTCSHTLPHKAAGQVGPQNLFLALTACPRTVLHSSFPPACLFLSLCLLVPFLVSSYFLSLCLLQFSATWTEQSSVRLKHGRLSSSSTTVSG